MNDFDRFLEKELRLMLDAVAATRPPVRKAHKTAAPVLALEAPIDNPGLGRAPVEAVTIEPALMIVSVPSATKL
jgi:hypothetical protein